MQQCSIANRIDRSMEKYHRTFYTSKLQQASSNWMPPLICKTFETTQKLSRIICFFISSSFTFRFIYSFPHPVTKNFRIFIFHVTPSYSCWTIFIHLFITLSEHCFHTVKFSWRACLYCPSLFILRQMTTKMYEKEHSRTQEYLIHSVVWRIWLE